MDIEPYKSLAIELFLPSTLDNKLSIAMFLE